MDPDNISGGTVLDASQLNAPGVTPPVGNVPPNGGNPPQAQPEAMTLSELNSFLGKDFKDKNTALKALKDTFSYVGKKKEDITAEVLADIKSNDKTAELSRQLQVMEDERFYDKNPDLDKPEIRKFISSTGKRPSEVAATTEFKAIFDKVTEYDKTVKLRTVLESNPRLASSSDNIKKAREILHKPVTGMAEAIRNQDEADALALDAVKTAFEL